LLFAVPMLIGNLFQQMYSVVDMIVVGRFVSGDALAAVGVSMSIVTFIVSVFIGLNTGASILISQFFGAKDFDRLKNTVAVSILVLLCMSAVIMVVATPLSPVLLRLLKTNDDIFEDSVVYLRILMVGIFFPVMYNMYTAYLRALGDSRRPLYILIFATILNVGLDLFFVIILDMGVAGAAIATVIAQTLAAVVCFLYATRYVPLLRVNRLFYDGALARLILKYGTPAALQLSIVSFAQLTITRLINSFGSAAMAGITAATRIDQFAILPIQNISMAMATFVAQNMGADLEGRAQKGFRTALLYMIGCALIMTALLLVFRYQLMALFVDYGDRSAPEILRIGGEYLNIMVIFYFMFAFLFAFNGFLRGVGDAMMAMVFPVISLTTRTVSAYALVGLAGMGPEALSWSIPIGWGVSSFLSWLYYKKRLWVGKVATRIVDSG